MQKPKVKFKKCRVCKTKFQPYSSTTIVCSIQCAIENNKVNAKRLEAKRLVIAKRQHKQALEAIKKRSDWLRESQTIFNLYIRLRDANELCISCGKNSNQWAAGHYRTVKAMPALRFNELNVHKQCNHYCNMNLSGNIVNYRLGLIKKIGLEKVEWLEGNHETCHYSIDDIKEIKNTYKNKIKELKIKMLDN